MHSRVAVAVTLGGLVAFGR